MRERLTLLLNYCLFWILFFLIARLLFLVYNYEYSSTLSLTDFLFINLHGLHIDLSAMGYLVIIPALMASFVLRNKILHYALMTYTFIMLLLSSFIIVSDLELYRHWGFRMDSTPLLYMTTDSVQSISVSSTLFLALIFIVFVGLSFYTYLRFLGKRTLATKNVNWKSSTVLFCITPLLIIPIRGSFDISPMRISKVYFHQTNEYANHSAINVLWNLGYDLKHVNKLNYPDNFYDPEKTDAIAKKVFSKPEGTTKLLNLQKPNVILIILESFTYKFIEPLGGLPDITPNINRLSKEGVLFSNFYSSGDRTDKGMVSIISGYPAQTKLSIIKYPRKTKDLPSLAENFKSMGYQTSFTYGGNLDFANFKTYLIQSGFDKLISEDDFPAELNNSKWGVHDHYVFHEFHKDVNTSKNPFFKIMLTLSSHEPFDVPMNTVIDGDDETSMFLNSAHYTDKSLGDFITEAKKEDWWENTLIVITADHGHRLPDNSHKEKFKIPMLWLGGALAVKDTVINTVAGQPDIANTILGQLDHYDPSFKFSRDILAANYDPFAIYIYKDGFGVIREEGQAAYYMIQNNYLYTEGDVSKEDLELGKAYMQRLFSDYNVR